LKKCKSYENSVGMYENRGCIFKWVSKGWCQGLRVVQAVVVTVWVVPVTVRLVIRGR